MKFQFEQNKRVYFFAYSVPYEFCALRIKYETAIYSVVVYHFNVAYRIMTMPKIKWIQQWILNDLLFLFSYLNFVFKHLPKKFPIFFQEIREKKLYEKLFQTTNLISNKRSDQHMCRSTLQWRLPPSIYNFENASRKRQKIW